MGNININYLLGHLQESQYNLNKLAANQVFDPRYGHHFPWFSYNTIDTMTRDPRIKFGLNLIKGPILTYTKFFNEEESESQRIHSAIVELNYYFPYAVICKNKKQEEFILSQITRFWDVAAVKALTAVEWGYSGSEVKYKVNKAKQLVFDNLRLSYSPDLQCVTRNKGIVGFIRDQNRKTYVPLGKGFWHLHEREQDHYYGNSRLRGAHIPWHETWMMGGARDIRRTWYFRHAYDGGEIYYPEGFSQDDQGNRISNEELAVKMADAIRTGAIAIFPSTKGLDGKRSWEREKPSSGVAPQGLDIYINTLRDEELEGLGIPPEVVQSGSDGFGAATGRMVPLMAFIASLTPLGSDLITDFREQILDPVLLPQNGFNDDYEIKRIVPKTQEEVQAEQAATQLQEKTIPNSNTK